MELRADDRALAVQVGVTILLGFIVLAIATYQVQVVPSQNARVEFGHSQTVQGQLQDVRGAVVSVPGGGPGRSVSVQLGTQYPERTIFLNPPAPSGQLRTTSAANVTLGNVAARGEAGDFWDGGDQNVSTQALVYEPDYRVYQNGPTTVIENTVVFDEQPRSPEVVIDSDQEIVDDREISLVALQGAYQEASTGTVSVDVDPVSASTRTVTVTNATPNTPVTVTIPTRLSVATWRDDLLADENVSQGGHVQKVTDGPRANTVAVELEPGVTYELEMALVGLSNGVDRPEPAYVTDVSGDGARVDEDTNETLVVEVRDRFNNPVSGVTVNASTSGPNSTVTVLDDSDSDGRVRLEYAAPPDVDGVQRLTEQVNVSFVDAATNTSAFDASAPENVTLGIAAINADGSGTGGSGGGAINPGSGVVQKDATITSQSGSSGTVDLTLENTGSETRNLTSAQYTFYSVDSQGGTSRPVPTQLTIDLTTFDLRGDLKEIQPAKIQFNSGQQKPVTLEFNDCVQEGDFFVLTTQFENGQTIRYFVAPTGGGNCGGGMGP